MTVEGFIEDVYGSLEDAPAGGLFPETDFKGLDCWDSLAVLAVSNCIEMEYGVIVRKKDYGECRTLRDLYDLVCSRKGG